MQKLNIFLIEIFDCKTTLCWNIGINRKIIFYLARVSIPDKIILCFSLELLSDLLDEDVVSVVVHVLGHEE